METAETIFVKWHMIRRNTGQERSWYEGRIFLELPTLASAELVEWCKSQDFVTQVEAGDISPTSLAVVLGETAEYDHAMMNRIFDFIRALSEHITLPLTQKGVTTWNYQWREGQSWLFTPEMLFLTDAGANAPVAGMFPDFSYMRLEEPPPGMLRPGPNSNGINWWIDIVAPTTPISGNPLLPSMDEANPVPGMGIWIPDRPPASPEQ